MLNNTVLSITTMAKLVGTNVGNPFLYTIESGRAVVVQTICAPLEILLETTWIRIITIILFPDFKSTNRSRFISQGPYFESQLREEASILSSILALLSHLLRLFHTTYTMSCRLRGKNALEQQKSCLIKRFKYKDLCILISRQWKYTANNLEVSKNVHLILVCTY